MMPIATFLFLTVAIQSNHSKFTVSDILTVIFLMFMQIFEDNFKPTTSSFGSRMMDEFITQTSWFILQRYRTTLS